MKMLVSDYDGTLVNNDEIIRDADYQKIRSFQKENAFVVASGRCVNGLGYLRDIGLEADYIIANSGALIVDNRLNVIYDSPIPVNAIEDIYKIIREVKVMSFEISNGYDFGICMLYPYESHQYNEFPDFLNRMINPLDIQREGNYHQFSLLMENEKAKQKALGRLANIKGIKTHINGMSIDITSSDASKAKAVGMVAKLIDADYVACVGDGLNDWEMISKYHGFAKLNGCLEVMDVAEHIVNNLEECIEIVEGELA